MAVVLGVPNFRIFTVGVSIVYTQQADTVEMTSY